VQTSPCEWCNDTGRMPDPSDPDCDWTTDCEHCSSNSRGCVPVPVHDEAYQAGGLAWFNERTERDNPYPIPSGRAERWLAGYRESQREFDAAGGTLADVELGEAGA
jgi:hypothetical protein